MEGSPGRTRTYDPAVNSRLLYQLSYRGLDLVMCYVMETPSFPIGSRILIGLEIEIKYESRENLWRISEDNLSLSKVLRFLSRKI